MMGITNTPLVIVVADEWYTNPGVLELMRQGHQVHNENKRMGSSDLALTRGAGWTADLFAEEIRANGEKYRPYLDAAVARARKRRRERE